MDFHGAAALCAETEERLWNQMGDTDPANWSPVVLSPSKREKLLALAKNGPLVGVVPFSIKSFSPVTAEAANEGCGSLSDALLWCAKQTSLPTDYEVPIGINFSREYLIGAMKMAQISAVGACVTFGLEAQTARLMNLHELDRWAIEGFIRHYEIRYELMGAQEDLHGDFQDPVHVALSDWLEAKPKQKNQCRKNFLKRMFWVQKIAGNVWLDGVSEDDREQNINRILKECEVLGTSLRAAQRLVELHGVDSREAYNRTRSCFRQPKGRAARYVPRSDKTALLLQICKSLMARALVGTCTASTVVEAWMWASLSAVKVARLDDVVGHEGFWLTWIEKKMQKYLRRLVLGDSNNCGEADSRSAKNNEQGEGYAAA